MNKKNRPVKLYNQLNATEAKQLLASENLPRLTISFYKYFAIIDPQQFRDEMFKAFAQLKVLGRIYVAAEGINAQLSIPEQNLDQLRTYLDTIPDLVGLRLNIATEHGESFWVLKIKVRQKIVADGINDPQFNMNKTGKYLDAEQFNQLSDDANTLVVDMRNHYEYEVGHFENAVEIPSETFREQLTMAVDILKENKDKNVVMYCTGGIRCEKASAWMLHNGFKNVYHLEGGIIHYINNVKKLGLTNKFLGKNFVFDGRMNEAVSEQVIAKCHQCGETADSHVNCANDGCHLLFIQCEQCAEKHEGCCSADCQTVIHLPSDQQKQLRKGKLNGSKIFNKSRHRLDQTTS